MSDKLEKVDASMTQLCLKSSAGKAEAANPHEELILDPRGDLRLEVGPVPHSFVVDSRSLARVSLVWNAMLLGGWSESQPKNGKAWVVQLPEDDAGATSVLLGIVHGHFPREPERIVPDELRLITEVADKYDMIHLLRPWAPTWIKHLKGNDIDDLEFQTCITYLCIAWNLGDRLLFELLAESILLRAKVDNKQNLLDSSGNALVEVPLIEHMDIIDSLLSRRSELIGNILGIVEMLLSFYLIDFPSSHELGCEAAKIARMCEKRADQIEWDCSMVLLGSFMRELEGESLFPIPGPSNVTESVKTLLARVTVLLKKVKPLGTGSKHEKCNRFPQKAKEIRDCVLHERRPTILTSSHRKHIFAQAQKTGCNGGKRP